MATTRRVVKLRPSRMRSTSYRMGTRGVARPQEVGVQGVDQAAGIVHRPRGRDEGLARDLPAEHALAALVR